MEDDRFVRAFIAIELSPTIIDNIRKVQDELKKGTSQVAWVKPENIHLTIRFLGDIKTDIINDINKIIELAASQLSNFKLSIKRIGAFPKIDNPRVIWVGVEDDSDLSRLYNEIENGLVALGFKKEERSFKPHLTLGRIRILKKRQELREMLERFADTNLGNFAVLGISLFKSKLTPTGAIYTKVKEVKLKTGEKQSAIGDR